MQIDGDPRTKMAEELDRVRISAAELRAEASTLVTRRGNVKEVREDKRHKQRDGKRPDMQRYQPSAGHKRKDSVETDDPQQAPSQTEQSAPAVDEAMSKKDMPVLGTDRPHSNAKHSVHRDATHQEDALLSDADLSNVSFESGGPETSGRKGVVVKDGQGSDPGLPTSPKHARKARKPDRQIYQAGGRWAKGGKDSAPNHKDSEKGGKDSAPNHKDSEKGGKDSAPNHKDSEKGGVDAEASGPSGEMEKGSREAELGHKDGGGRESERALTAAPPGDLEDSRGAAEPQGKGRGERGRGRRSKDSNRKQEPGRPRRDGGGPGLGKEGRGRRGGTGQTEGVSGNDRKGKSEQGVELGPSTPEGGNKKRDKGGRRTRGGDRTAQSEWTKSEPVEKGRSLAVTPEAGAPRQPRDSARQAKDHNIRARRRDVDAERLTEDADRSKANRTKVTTASKRYSKSDIRRARNRTCSTSSASSVTSLDGPLEGDRRRAPAGDAGLGARDGAQPSAHRAAGERTDGGRPNANHRRRRNNRDMSSSDSLEESHWEKGHLRRARASDGDWSPERTPEKSVGAQRGGSVSVGGRGGILRVAVDRQTCSTRGAPAPADGPPGRRQSEAPRGRGRGILVLPAHTDLTRSPEPGPKLFGGARWSRGRGGRGGGTRRLWDPNNPDQKPALAARGQLHPPHGTAQLPLYMLPHGGYGPLHFHDTDDEAAGSPPVHKGEHFKAHPNSAVAYYKFQNSDNPYCYPVPADASGTPPRYAYPYAVPYAGAMYPSPPHYSSYGPAAQGGHQAGPPLSPEEAEEQARGELARLLRAALTQELQLSNLLSRDHVSLDGLERMAQLRAELLTMYERVLLTDIEFSDSQNLDQALWKNVFYQVIERFRQMMKESPADTPAYVRNMLFTVLDEGAVFFDGLLLKLQTVFQFKLEDYMDGMAIRSRPLRKTVKYALISAQRCMICQGDLARYREQATDSANYGKARSWYLKAQQIAPKNGRPYNQLALLAVYTKRKLDAVYYYMRSLAASNPILTAKESLMGLFEEAKRKTDDVERRKQQESEGASRGPRGRGGGRGGGGGGGGRGSVDHTREEIWIRPSRQPGGSWPESESGKDSDLDGELGTLSSRDLQKRFILSFLHAHGKLFTKVGMETFPAVASRVLQEFRVLLQHSPSPLGSTRLLQIITINMFTIHNAQSRDGDGDVRSMLQEQATSLGLAMFGLLVQRCSQLVREAPTDAVCVDGCEAGSNCTDCAVEKMVRVSAFSPNLHELLPSAKVWSDWMLGHPENWNPPPNSMYSSGGVVSVWVCLAELCNELARVYHDEAALYKEPCYIDRSTDQAIAADCKRITQLKYFLEALCGQEEPLLAFKGGKYVSMVTAPTPASEQQLKENQNDDVIVEAESSQSGSEADLEAELADGSGDDIKELRARRNVLSQKLAQQQKRRDKIQEVLQTCRRLELQIHPVYLVPDTNGFIDHLEGLHSLVACSLYVVVVPLIVITELDGLAKGQQDCRDGGGAHVRHVQERAKEAVGFLEKSFEAREPCLRALTSRGNQLDSIALRSEDISGQKGTNDDVILSCCLHYCKDKPKDLMPSQQDGKVRLRREVVLLTDDRNLRVKALTRNVPVRDIPAFLRWAKVG
ncbi:hypothetical protein AALO_G00034140 [Alosa alosa]|uniref:Telomerase-binding protein EST1A n=1 Tax=Alosa alosa TaxID=278164 RepID=A0AAV6HGN4_9TELE|nr:hypothetical protein AALO_G00034140 [Alosa alosa]